jgi:hypothetical protein
MCESIKTNKNGRIETMPNSDSPNTIDDEDERPEGLCKTCGKNCYSDWVVELCSEYTEAK